MKLRWGIVAPLTALVTLVLVGGIQARLDEQRVRAFDQELLYLPNEHLLTHFTAGMGPVIADFLWLRTLSYTVEEFHGDGRFTWLAQMGDVMTRLDPYFVNAYRFTGMFLAALKADDDASIELLKRGIPHNPTAWELPHEIGLIYLTNRRDWPGAPELAAQWLRASDATGQAPERVRATLEGLLAQHRLTDLERSMWENILLSSKDQFERAIAERKLNELLIRENVELLNQAADRFETVEGRRPASFADMVSAGILPGEPDSRDVFGGHYFVDDEGTVRNTTLLDLLVEQRQNRLMGAVRRFHRDEGRWPHDLDELVLHGQLNQLPPHPYPERAWRYDPDTGTIE